MKAERILDKLEDDLSHFLISEHCKKRPELKNSYEMYKYKGLNITADINSKKQEKTVRIRIGALEAEFKIENGDKHSGGLDPRDEHLISIWMNMNENNYNLRCLFNKQVYKKEIKILPFDLEEIYEQI